MSPSANVLAAALVTGQLQLVNFSSDGGNAPATAEGASASSLSSTVSITIAAPSRNTISSAAPSKGNSKGSSKEDDEDDDDPDQDDGDTPSCRAVCFAAGGGSVLAGYADAAVRLYDSSTGKLSATYAGHHKEQISRVFSVDGNVFASGDEAGAVALWDVRAPPQQAPLYKYGKHTDYVTDFALHERDQALVVCSGDGTISIHDLRKRWVRLGAVGVGWVGPVGGRGRDAGLGTVSMLLPLARRGRTAPNGLHVKGHAITCATRRTRTTGALQPWVSPMAVAPAIVQYSQNRPPDPTMPKSLPDTTRCSPAAHVKQ